MVTFESETPLTEVFWAPRRVPRRCGPVLSGRLRQKSAAIPRRKGGAMLSPPRCRRMPGWNARLGEPIRIDEVTGAGDPAHRPPFLS